VKPNSKTKTGVVEDSGAVETRSPKLPSLSALEKAKAGMFLNLRELSEATGFCYSIIKQWRSQGMPLIDGKIMLSDAVAWRKSQPAEVVKSRVEVQSPSTTVLNHPLLAAGKSCGLKSKNG